MVRRTLIVVELLLYCQWDVTTAFWATLPCRTTTTTSSSSTVPPTASRSGSGGGGAPAFLSAPLWMAPLSNEEIFARAQQTKEDQDVPPPPKIFEDDMLNDMQAALLLLEKRVQEGPLTILEVDHLTSQLTKIRFEMKHNQHKKPPRPSSVAAASPEPSAAAPRVIDLDTPPADEEGPAYDGRGGMGQAAGTANTYVIPGMEEMTADEYQAALEQTIIDRQRQRRYSGNVTGNRSTWNYLNSLTGESGILKKKSDL
jgi:hypothetical protein